MSEISLKEQGQEYPSERIERGIWRPGILQEFESSVGAGMSTKILKQEIGATGNVRITGKRDRLDTPFSQASPEERTRRFAAGRILARLLQRIAPEADPHHITKTALTHGSRVVIVDEDYLKRDRAVLAHTEADGLVTNMKDVPLMVAAADCAPVGIYDDERKVIGLFHSGWKSTVQRIVPKGIDAMQQQFRSNPKSLRVFVGPYSGANMYEVGADVYEQLRAMKAADGAPYYTEGELEQFFRPHPDPAKHGKLIFDNGAAIKFAAIKAGVPEDHVEVSQHSTIGEPDVFSSERIEGAEKRDSNVTMLVLRSDTQYRIIDGERYLQLETGLTGAPIDHHVLFKGCGYFVDLEKSPTLKNLYSDVKGAITDTMSEREILDVVMQKVKELFVVSDKTSVERFNLVEKNKHPLVSLEAFAVGRHGNCSQCSLSGGLMLERLKADGVIPGTISIEEAYWEGEFVAGGHIWLHYHDANGQITVVDIAQQFIGTQEEQERRVQEMSIQDLLDF